MIKRERRIPTLLALLTVFVGVGTTAFLVEHFQNITTQAKPSIIPHNVKITNLSSNSFTVSWLTEEKTKGFVTFGDEKSLTKTVFDERDEEKNLGKYFTHYVSVKNLKPASTYYFKIISQSKKFDQNGLPYEVKTVPTLPSSSPIEPAYGTVLNKNNTPAQGAIVYLTFKGALPLSTLTKPSGNFLIPLNLAVNSNLKECFTHQEGQEEEIVVRASIEETAIVVTDTNNDSPIPTIILGKSYDFRGQKGREGKSLAKKDLPQKVLGTKEAVGGIEIIFPKEGTALLDPKPLFKGKGIPRNKVVIEIKSPRLLEETVVDPNGRWFFRPKKPLTPGKHTITITTKNKDGEEITLNRSFLVLKSGTQVLGEATPSATLTPTSPPTATPIPATPIPATPTPSVLSPAPTSPPVTPTPSLIPGSLTFTINSLSLGVLLLSIGMGMVFVLR